MTRHDRRGSSTAGLALLLLCAPALACSTMDHALDRATGKAQIEDDYSRFRESADREREDLEASNRELERSLHTTREELAELERRYREVSAELDVFRSREAAEAGRINVMLFGGDILYAVSPDAFGDYRAGLRMRSLVDSEFAAALREFEEGRGGDAELLLVLRQVDTSNDRLIAFDEARAFRQAQDGSFAKAQR